MKSIPQFPQGNISSQKLKMCLSQNGVFGDKAVLFRCDDIICRLLNLVVITQAI